MKNSKFSRFNSDRGFTLIELLVVISIIVLILSMSAPLFMDYREQRELRSSAQLFQGAFTQARTTAISKKIKVFLVLFPVTGEIDLKPGATTTTSVKKGAKGSIYLFDASKPIGGGIESFASLAPPIILPEQANVSIPAEAKVYKFNSSGVVFFSGDRDDDPDESNLTDIVVSQKGVTRKCFLDLSKNTGKVSFAIR